MLDLAPTVLEGAGLGIPGQLDGRPLPFAAARGA
jgi:arylsulfatase A-like enzyme